MTKQLSVNPVASYLWQHIRVYKRAVLAIAVMLPVTILINGYLPTLVMANVLGMLTSHRYSTSQLLPIFGPYLVIYAVMIVTGMYLWRLIDRLMWYLEGHVSRDIATEVFDHLMRESADFHANHFGGSLVAQANKLVSSYIRTADTTIFQTYPLVAGVIIASIVLAVRAPLFVALLLIFSTVFILVAFKVSAPVRKLGAEHASIESKQTGYLADAISNAMAIKSFARSKYESKRFYDAAMRTYSSMFAFARLHGKQMSSLGLMGRSISAMSLTMVVVSVLLFRANIATAFLILSYTTNIVEQLFQFSQSAIRNYNRSLSDGADMVAILAREPAILDPIKPEKSKIQRGDIVFSHVDFTHNGAASGLFKDLNLHIKAGEKVGLVGHSGSGKTTLTRLLLRFSDIQNGEIVIDRQTITRITQDDLHRKVTYVPQEPILFHRTLRENIGYGDEQATDQEIQAVARLAHAHDFIAALPDGYDTLVGERGVKLSGGQRQRVAIARAMLKNAPILVLDEATAALDSESEALIQDALWKLMEGRTAIVVAHRLSTIQKMDRIIVLDEGEIIEQGTHKELLHRNGQYAKLWQRQSGGFIEE